MHNLSFIALGSNLSSSSGSSRQTIQAALKRLSATPELSLQSVSRFYQTPAFPAGNGPDYVNACAAVESGLAAGELLALLHGIEADLGRVRSTRWAARGIDLDLIATGQQVLPDDAAQDRWRALPPQRQLIETPDHLVLPHPRLQDRAFVLVPLSDIAPGWTHPRTGLSVVQMLENLPPEDRASLRVLLDNAPKTDHITASRPVSDSNR
ncbi:2-amino-4-hydroxy-6-hydroxymethyldihydropteridine diphosphokinase [Paracoccus aurantiacus]|nr:2-amino-4-hydroxy-6-hydroxymethyldihydropteridine diphosphokinase [Paracoccus aurantiacus]